MSTRLTQCYAVAVFTMVVLSSRIFFERLIPGCLVHFYGDFVPTNGLFAMVLNLILVMIGMGVCARLMSTESCDRLTRRYAVAVLALPALTLLGGLSYIDPVSDIMWITLPVLNLVLVIVGGWLWVRWWIHGRKPLRLLSWSVLLAISLLFFHFFLTPAIL